MEFLSVNFHGLGTEGVDESNRTIRGMVVALEGDFVDGRGHFNSRSLREIAATINTTPKGLRSRFGHPGLLEADGLGKFLGRQTNARISSAHNRQGARVPAVRADLTLDESSFHTPFGDLGGYVLRLAKSDPDALSSSLVIWPDMEERGKGLAPAWYPKELKASDIVSEGAAVAGLLERADVLMARLGEILDKAFDAKTREEREAFWQSYLLKAYGELEPPAPTPQLDKRRHAMESMNVAARSLKRG